jgi:hypothetical protein
MSDFLIGGFKTIKQREIQAVCGNAGIAALAASAKLVFDRSGCVSDETRLPHRLPALRFGSARSALQSIHWIDCSGCAGPGLTHAGIYSQPRSPGAADPR